MTEQTTYQCDLTGREFNNKEMTVRVTIERLNNMLGGLSSGQVASGHLDANELDTFADKSGVLTIFTVNGTAVCYKVTRGGSLRELDTKTKRQAAHKLVNSLTQ
jgi:hypothetical protein